MEQTSINCDDNKIKPNYEYLIQALKCYNGTNESELKELIEEMQYKNNHPFFSNPEVAWIITAVFMLLMIFGMIGSALVVYVVVMRPNMRSPRNIFIANLAISDFVLCILTQPFNLIRILMVNNWVLGGTMCKFSAMLQGTNIFVCTISITAIALDRFQVIVHPTVTSLRVKTTMIMLVAIWLISGILASPLLYFNKLQNSQCTERSQSSKIMLAKLTYSIISVTIQYVVPLIIVTMAYTRICIRIRKRMNRYNPTQTTTVTFLNSPNHNNDARTNKTNELLIHNIDSNVTKMNEHDNLVIDRKLNKRKIEEHRKRRTNWLLFLISLTFALSWLPLVTFNLSLDIRELMFVNSFKELSNTQEQPLNYLSRRTVDIIQTICLLAVLGSACINPILYGWLNDNFRKEFNRIYKCKTKRRDSILQTQTNNNTLARLEH